MKLQGSVDDGILPAEQQYNCAIGYSGMHD
jgi:hypothetical protein